MVAAPLALARLERGAVTDRDEDVLQRRPARMVCVDVAGDDRRCAEVLGEVAQEPVPVRVTALERALELDEEAVSEGACELHRRIRIAHAEPVARAAGEADEPVVRLSEERGIERRRQRVGSLLRPGVRMCRRQQPAEVRVALGGLHEERHVMPSDECHLGARDRPDAEVLRRVGELERAVDPVMVRECERLVAELGRAQRELLRVRRAVEERIR